MIKLREATESEKAGWLDDWSARLQSWYTKPDVPAEWAERQIQQRLGRYQLTDLVAATAVTLAITAGDDLVGLVAIAAPDERAAGTAVISDVWVAEPHRRQGYARQAVRLAEDWARDHDAVRVMVGTDPAQPSHAALFSRYPIRAIQMIKRLAPPVTLPDGVSARPMTPAEFDTWREHTVRDYAAQMAASGAVPDAQAATEAARQFEELLPDGLASANQTLLSLIAGGEQVAMNWIGHRYGPATSWVYDVVVGEGYRGQGYGRPAMLIGEQATLAAGDTHLGLNVFGQNSVAIHLYESLGYRAYDHARSLDL
ncbi:MAG TPA: GNAT family N-acetyltransferase [Streptosporangiaceae bacterium]